MEKRHLKTYFEGYSIEGDADVTSLSVPFFVTGQISLTCTLQIGKESSVLWLSLKTNVFHRPLKIKKCCMWFPWCVQERYDRFIKEWLSS